MYYVHPVHSHSQTQYLSILNQTYSPNTVTVANIIKEMSEGKQFTAAWPVYKARSKLHCRHNMQSVTIVTWVNTVNLVTLCLIFPWERVQNFLKLYCSMYTSYVSYTYTVIDDIFTDNTYLLIKYAHIHTHTHAPPYTHTHIQSSQFFYISGIAFPDMTRFLKSGTCCFT